MWHWDSNPRPSDHESPPITTRQGLPPMMWFFLDVPDLSEEQNCLRRDSNQRTRPKTCWLFSHPHYWLFFTWPMNSCGGLLIDAYSARFSACSWLTLNRERLLFEVGDVTEVGVKLWSARLSIDLGRTVFLEAIRLKNCSFVIHWTN